MKLDCWKFPYLVRFDWKSVSRDFQHWNLWKRSQNLIIWRIKILFLFRFDCKRTFGIFHFTLYEYETNHIFNNRRRLVTWVLIAWAYAHIFSPWKYKDFLMKNKWQTCRNWKSLSIVIEYLDLTAILKFVSQRTHW